MFLSGLNSYMKLDKPCMTGDRPDNYRGHLPNYRWEVLTAIFTTDVLRMHPHTWIMILQTQTGELEPLEELHFCFLDQLVRTKRITDPLKESISENHTDMQKIILLQEDFLTGHLVRIKRTEDLPWESLNEFIDLTTRAKLKEYLKDPLNHTKGQMKR